MTETVVKIAAEAAWAAVHAVSMASAKNSQRAQNVGPKLGRPIQRQLTFDWSSTDKYAELGNFIILYSTKKLLSQVGSRNTKSKHTIIKQNGS